MSKISKNNKTISQAVALVAVMSLPCSAQAATYFMDFLPSVSITAGGFVQDGIRLSNDANDYLINFADYNGYGTPEGYSGSASSETWTIELVSGGAFDLQSILVFTPEFPPPDISLTGNLAGGGTVAHTILSGDIDYINPSVMPGSFTNLLSVTLVEPTGYSLYFDEILLGEATVVPVPAAIWLFGSGLMGLFGVARRKVRA